LIGLREMFADTAVEFFAGSREKIARGERWFEACDRIDGIEQRVALAAISAAHTGFGFQRRNCLISCVFFAGPSIVS